MKQIIALLIFLETMSFAASPGGINIQFSKDGRQTNVTEDSVTPANSVGLPVTLTGGAVLGAVNQGTAGVSPWVFNLTKINGSSISLGSTVSSGSLPVVIASDQGAIPVTGTFTNPSVGTTGTSVPGSATYVGFKNQAGNLVGPVLTAGLALLTDSSATTQPVSGTFWQATQPVSGAFFQATQPVSAVSLPLASGASTSAKQPALGTAGAASSDVITVQGIASMTALKVDGSGVTQPVSAVSLPLATGASTSALQTTGNTALTTINTTLGSPFQAGASIGNASFGVTGSVQTKAPLNSNSSGATGTVSTVITLTAPANAVGFVLMNLDTSTTNIRWALGRSATTTVGSQLEPGRDTGFIPAGSNVTIVSESGTNGYDINWVSQ